MDASSVSYALLELNSDPMERSVAIASEKMPPLRAPRAFHASTFDDLQAVANSGLVTRGQLIHANNIAYMTAYSLGQVLVAMDYVTEDQLSQVETSTVVITRRGQTGEFKRAAWMTAPSPAANSSTEPPESNGENGVRIGELLEAARLINQRELAIAVSLSFTDTRKIGQIMVSSGFLSEESLQLALDCQNAVSKHKLPADRASAVLKHCVQQGYSIPEGIFDLGYSHDPTIMVFM